MDHSDAPTHPKPGSSMARVLNAAEQAGLTIDIKTMDQSTRTAEEAATDCGCRVAQIVKSLVFAEGSEAELVLLLISGTNRVDTDRMRASYGLDLARADPRKVREQTGFAIGGVAPIGHLNPLRVYMDESLLDFEEIWAAAGRPDSVFRVSAADLERAVKPTLISMHGRGG